ncbi:methylated-DNA--[protein]-cysteine S-methyltransferase [Methylophilus aquaticus]|uniref:Methylated-DNA--[protein]-cysteine S-methyltransferase n=1 Tax=Methylophilus aquaticus TaxID=1971610 RepID=A0ABT9JPR4_9PROT|nr:methylated-DNA--[protein]-cysteine S-methyltransferase [Methylophilus aquaticus]MDP8566552.1 methylated-DNA--[protein]-cysteine S-methyltransferase [Methylophilus aquaticus]
MKPPSNTPLDALVPAPFGFVGVRCDETGDALQLLMHALPLKAQPNPRASSIADQVAAYLDNPRSQWQAIASSRGTAFQQRVWQAMREIPVGETCTYAQLAAAVHSGPRAVANACGANPLPLFNPCHRVVASNGMGGFMQGVAEGLEIKRWLLAHEQKGTP